MRLTDPPRTFEMMFEYGTWPLLLLAIVIMIVVAFLSLDGHE